MQNSFSQTVRSFFSPILEYIDSPEISEIMINSHSEIWVESGGKVLKTETCFESQEALMSAVNNIAQFVKRRIDEETPTMDARLPDGSRIHVVLPPCSQKGICISIRKFKKALTLEKLLDYESITEDAIEFIRQAIIQKRNILVSGGTGSGKTSLLNALTSLVPNEERIIVIEDSSELKLQQDHVVYLETKEPDRHGKGKVSIRDLLRSTLRLRPDRIIVGEIRGEEAIDFLQAMNTGHGGSMGTLHANSPLDALYRLETLTLFSGIAIPLTAIRAQVASSIDLIVQTTRYRNGARKISYISEVKSLQSDISYELSNLFLYNKKTDTLDCISKEI